MVAPTGLGIEMIVIANNLQELGDSVATTRSYSNAKAFPTEFQTYDEKWDELQQSIDHLKFMLGPERYPKLKEMLAKAKSHYDEEAETGDDEQGKLGSWLMQDIGLIVDGKEPMVYPKELYRW